jgi:hypothetical protein
MIRMLKFMVMAVVILTLITLIITKVKTVLIPWNTVLLENQLFVQLVERFFGILWN